MKQKILARSLLSELLSWCVRKWQGNVVAEKVAVNHLLFVYLSTIRVTGLFNPKMLADIVEAAQTLHTWCAHS